MHGLPLIDRRLQALLFRVFDNVCGDYRLVPRRYRPIPVMGIGTERLRQDDVRKPLRKLVPEFGVYVNDFEELWSDVASYAVAAHSNFDGDYAGAGPVDFVEGFTLYSLVRHYRPSRVLELGFAAGISSWILASALLANDDGGCVDTVDIADDGTVAPFKRLVSRGVIRPYIMDGRDYLRNEILSYELTFSDALHTLDFNREVAYRLRNELPDAIHCYHEWSLAPHARRQETRYVSMRKNLGQCGERRAFEINFPSELYRHVGIPSSCGLGVVVPRRSTE